MRRRRTAEEVARSLREFDRDLARVLTISDICRKQGIAEATYYQWRQQHDPEQVDTDRRCREPEREVDRLKRLVAELLLDKQMLQQIAKKVVTPNQQRAAADFLGEHFRVSQRRACRVMDRASSTLRYRPRRRADEPALSWEIKRLARRHPRYGYRRVHALLVRRGWSVNPKRVRRRWNELGLRRPLRLRKPRELDPKPGASANSCIEQLAKFKNEVWTCDFIHARTASGRPLKWLTLVDEYTRECLVLHAAESISGADVRRILARVIGRRGAPTRIRSENGSEFVCEALVGWLPGMGADPIPVAPAGPWENGYIESFHSRLRDEFLERIEFEDVADARAKGSWFRREYNAVRPHSSLSYTTPKEFSAAGDRKENRGRLVA
jgi:transposase InsO family protein